MAEPQEQKQNSSESAGGVEQRIVGRSSAAGNESLMKLVGSGVRGSDEQCDQPPGPAPARAAEANATKEQQRKDKVFSEMRALANEMMDDRKLFSGYRGVDPPQDWLEDGGGVLR